MSRLAFALAFLAVALAPTASAAVAPLPPTNVQWTEVDGGVEVTWDAPAHDGGSPILYYRVYRDDALIADEVTDLTYLDDDLPIGPSSAAATSVTYTVTAVNAEGESTEDMGTKAYTTCVSFSPPGVGPFECVDIVLTLAFWVVDQIPLLP